jgi:hypothetical protein
MGWIGVVLAGASGLVAAVVAHLVVRNRGQRKGWYIAVFVLAFLLLRTVSTVYVVPRVREWETNRELRAIPFYRELATYDPALYQRVAAITADGLARGDSATEISGKITPILMAGLPKYMRNASDESMVEYLKFMVDSLDELGRTDPDDCYAFLFPAQAEQAGVAKKALSSGTEERALKMLDDVMLSAMKNPQAAADPAKADEILRPILINLKKSYGADLALVGGAARDAGERKKVCVMSDDMFKQISMLSAKDASLVFRDLLAEKP